MLGLVVGLAAEAKIARQFFPDVEICGGRPELAAKAAALLIAKGARGLVSFGICGGLDKDLRCGDLVVGTAATNGSETIIAEWERMLPQDLPRGAVYSPERFVLGAAEKAELHHRTGARIVDMESFAVARTARLSGLPFAILRSVADPAGQTLPAAVTRGLGSDGNPQILPVLAALAADPAALPGLIAAARASRIALDTLFRRGGALLLALG